MWNIKKHADLREVHRILCLLKAGERRKNAG
jgi:hypothetical protein